MVKSWRSASCSSMRATVSMRGLICCLTAWRSLASFASWSPRTTAMMKKRSGTNSRGAGVLVASYACSFSRVSSSLSDASKTSVLSMSDSLMLSNLATSSMPGQLGVLIVSRSAAGAAVRSEGRVPISAFSTFAA